jgi:hypothetical protein
MKSEDKSTIDQEKTIKTTEQIKFKGRFISAIGKRKSAVARLRLYKKGNGIIVIKIIWPFTGFEYFHYY